MDIRTEIAKLIVVLFALGPVVAQDPALLRVRPALLRVRPDSYTLSSSLKWLPRKSIETPGIDVTERFFEGIPVAHTENYEDLSPDDDNVFHICRAYDHKNDLWLLGTVHESTKVCQVRHSEPSVHIASHYEVLYNANGIRLKWETIQFFDTLNKVNFPSNAVAVAKTYFIARIPIENDEKVNETEATDRSYLIFKLDQRNSSQWITFDGEKKRYLPGITGLQLLVEMEPELYEVKINEMASESASYESKRPRRELGEVTLRNTSPYSSKVESTIPFHWLYESHLSSNVSMPQGINTIIYLDSCVYCNSSGKFKWNKEAVIWDNDKEEMRHEHYSVSAFLPAETGVRITLQAILVDVTDHLVGSLSTVYNDKSMDPEIPRPIAVNWWRTELTDLETVYGSMFHLSNNSITATKISPADTKYEPTNTTSSNNSMTLEKGSSFMNARTTFPPTSTFFPYPNTRTPPPSTYSPYPNTSTPPPSTYSPYPNTSTPLQSTYSPYPKTTAPPPSTTSPHPITTTLPLSTSSPHPTPTTAHPTTYHPPTSSPTPPPTTNTPFPTPTTITPSPAPITTTTNKNFVNFDMTLYFKLKMKIPVK